MTAQTQKTRWQYAAAIAAAGTTSGAVGLKNSALVGVLAPAAWTAASVALQVRLDGVNWFPAYDAAGTPLVLALVAGGYTAIPAGALHGLEEIRFVSSVAQVSAVSLTAVLRPFV